MNKNIVFKVLIISILILLQACVAMDRSKIDVGRQSFLDGDYHKAFSYLLPAAKKGNADAEYALGYMYFYGLGTPQDKEQGFRWMLRAANQGQVQAQQALTILRGDDFTTMKSIPVVTETTDMIPIPKKPTTQQVNEPVVIDQPLMPVEQMPPPRNNGSKPVIGAPLSKASTPQTFAKKDSTDAYTIQLMGSYDKSELDKFLQQHSIKANVMLTQRAGKDWYVLVYGNYNNKKLAQNAIKDLPVPVQQNQPWVRKVEDLSAVG